MGGAFTSALRLIAAGWVLVRYDALAPGEIEALLPPLARWVARLLRLFAGKQARIGRPGERLAFAFERMGPVTIKLGQMLSTRADIFGGTFAQDLNRLKDRLAPFPLAVAMAEIEASLQVPAQSLFVSIEPALAAASIAQAHRAVMTDGRVVAVKVLRPGIERRVALDIGALRLGAYLAEAAAPPLRRLEPRALVDTVARSLELELDMRLEASAASELGEVMAGDGHMRAPAVVWEGVGRRVLTLEWAQGQPMSDPAALEQPGMDRKLLAQNLIRGFLAQALDHGAFHADLHEGNLFCAPPGMIMAVDFGIVGRIGAPERRYLAEILWGFLKRDYRRVAEVHFEAGYVPAHHSVELFAQALRAVGEPVLGRSADQVSMGRLLAQLFEVTALFDMRLRPELVLLQKTMVTVEGVARRLDPQHDIWAAARPVVERWIARELSAPARLKTLAKDVSGALKGLVHLSETLPVLLGEPRNRPPSGVALWAMGVAVAALMAAAFAVGAVVMR